MSSAYTFLGGVSDSAVRDAVVSELVATRIVPTAPVGVSAGFVHILSVDDTGAQVWMRMQKPPVGSAAVGKVLVGDGAGTDLVWVSAASLVAI